MKKFMCFLLCLSLLLLSSCSMLSHEAEYETQSQHFADGQEDAVVKIQDAAKYQYETYVNVEELKEVLRANYGNMADDIIDDILFSPDLEHYSTNEIVYAVIDECVWEFE